MLQVWLRASWLTILLTVTTTTISAQVNYRQSALPNQRTLDRFGLKRAWWNQAGMNTARDRLQFLTVDEELAYAQSTSGMVTAFDNSTGKKLWAVQLGQRDNPILPAISNDELVLAVNGVTLYAVKKFSGAKLWELRLPKAPSTSPSMDDNQIYIGTLDGSVYAFDLEKINELYIDQKLPKWSFQAVAWRFKTGSLISTPPVPADRLIHFASTDKSLYSVDVFSRKHMLQFETDAQISAPLSFSNGYIYLASEDYFLYCINVEPARPNMEMGQLRWQMSAELPIRTAPRVIGDGLFLTPDQGGMHYLSAMSGAEIWWRPKIEDFISASYGYVYASNEAGDLAIMSRKDGMLVGVLPLRQFSIRVANERTDRIYLATELGRIVCLHEKSREFPLYHLFPERRPILPEFAPETPPAGSEPPTPDIDAPAENADPPDDVQN